MPRLLMVPTLELPPAMPFTCHVTAVFDVFCTVAVNVFVVFTLTVAVAGETETLTGGVIVTLAVPTAEESAALVACIATVAGFGI